MYMHIVLALLTHRHMSYGVACVRSTHFHSAHPLASSHIVTNKRLISMSPNSIKLLTKPIAGVKSTVQMEPQIQLQVPNLPDKLTVRSRAAIQQLTAIVSKTKLGVIDMLSGNSS